MAVAALIATLSRLLPQLLPPRARAVTLEVNSWLVTVRVFMEGPVTDDAMYDALHRELEPMLGELGPPESDPWELHLMLVRQDFGPARALGRVIWLRQDTTVEALGPEG